MNSYAMEGVAINFRSGGEQRTCSLAGFQSYSCYFVAFTQRTGRLFHQINSMFPVMLLTVRLFSSYVTLRMGLLDSLRPSAASGHGPDYLMRWRFCLATSKIREKEDSAFASNQPNSAAQPAGYGHVVTEKVTSCRSTMATAYDSPATTEIATIVPRRRRRIDSRSMERWE